MNRVRQILMLTSTLLSCQVAFAVNYNLSLTATIVEHSCEVVSGDQDFTVQLGKRSTKDISKVGSHTETVPFAIQLNKCTADTVKAKFQGTPDAIQPELLALSVGSTAQHVAVEILDHHKQRLPLNSGVVTQQVNAQKNVILQFYAHYVATNNGVTAGSANATANLILTYE